MCHTSSQRHSERHPGGCLIPISAYLPLPEASQPACIFVQLACWPLITYDTLTRLPPVTEPHERLHRTRAWNCRAEQERCISWHRRVTQVECIRFITKDTTGVPTKRRKKQLLQAAMSEMLEMEFQYWYALIPCGGSRFGASEASERMAISNPVGPTASAAQCEIGSRVRNECITSIAFGETCIPVTATNGMRRPVRRLQRQDQRMFVEMRYSTVC